MIVSKTIVALAVYVSFAGAALAEEVMWSTHTGFFPEMLVTDTEISTHNDKQSGWDEFNSAGISSATNRWQGNSLVQYDWDIEQSQTGVADSETDYLFDFTAMGDGNDFTPVHNSGLDLFAVSGQPRTHGSTDHYFTSFIPQATRSVSCMQPATDSFRWVFKNMNNTVQQCSSTGGVDTKRILARSMFGYNLFDVRLQFP